MRPQTRVWARRLVLTALCLGLLSACDKEGPTPTQLVVSVGADDDVSAELTQLLVETYDPDQIDDDGQPKAGGTQKFTLASESAQADAFRLPFSFAIVPEQATRVLLVVTGLRGRTPVIEQKALVAFVRGQARVVSIYLGANCHELVCGQDSDAWLALTCAPDGVCGELPVLETQPYEPHEPGGELETVRGPSEVRDAGLDARVDASDEDVVIPDADVDAADSASSDGSTDANPGPFSGPDAEAGRDAEAGLDAEAGTDAEAGLDAEAGTDAEAGLDAEAGTDAEAGPPACNANFEPNDAGACVPRNFCRNAPCGAGHVCNSGASDFTCTCATTHFQADAKRCIPKFAGLGAGLSHMCAWRSDGSVVCWGDNSHGQLARPTSELLVSVQPLVVSGVNAVSPVSSVSGGVDHTCALHRNSQVSCWGLNDSGQLGDGSTVNRSAPTLVPNLATVTKLTAGHYHTCALRSDGGVWCWGANAQGQLGRSGGIALRPEQVAGISGAVDIAAGGFNTCALLSDARALCWGHNEFGQLANNMTADASGPVVFASAIAQIAIGEGHICGLTTTAGLFCAGHNHQGQLGIGSTTDQRVPSAVTVASAASITLGAFHSCVRQSAGTALCWGENQWGEVGNGSMIDARAPVAVANLAGATTLVAGGYHTCALRPDGNVLCWGSNEAGELGNGTRTDSALPTTVLLPAN
jgi:alpha-tubulin suppressor-like RCC1 family protein